MLGHVQEAASEAVDNTIRGPGIGNQMAEEIDAQNRNQRQYSIFPENQHYTLDHGPFNSSRSIAPPIVRSGQNGGPWNGRSSQESVNFREFRRSFAVGYIWLIPLPPGNEPVATPSSHRQRLMGDSTPMMGLTNDFQATRTSGTTMAPRRFTQVRQPLSNIHGNAGIGSNSGDRFAGYGLRASIKTSQPTGNTQSSNMTGTRSSIRSRGQVSSIGTQNLC